MIVVKTIIPPIIQVTSFRLTFQCPLLVIVVNLRQIPLLVLRGLPLVGLVVILVIHRLLLVILMILLQIILDSLITKKIQANTNTRQETNNHKDVHIKDPLGKIESEETRIEW